jgi:hypothetical protein
MDTLRRFYINAYHETTVHRRGVQYHPQPTEFAAIGSFEVWAVGGM